VVYFNGAATPDGTILLWDADQNGLVGVSYDFYVLLICRFILCVIIALLDVDKLKFPNIEYRCIQDHFKLSYRLWHSDSQPFVNNATIWTSEASQWLSIYIKIKI